MPASFSDSDGAPEKITLSPLPGYGPPGGPYCFGDGASAKIKPEAALDFRERFVLFFYGVSLLIAAGTLVYWKSPIGIPVLSFWGWGQCLPIFLVWLGTLLMGQKLPGKLLLFATVQAGLSPMATFFVRGADCDVCVLALSLLLVDLEALYLYVLNCQLLQKKDGWLRRFYMLNVVLFWGMVGSFHIMLFFALFAMEDYNLFYFWHGLEELSAMRGFWSYGTAWLLAFHGVFWGRKALG